MAAGGNVPQFASLYVGDLHPDVTEAILYEIFNSVGTVGSIRVCRDSVSRRSLGYGYVNFHSVVDAERALDTLNYSSIKGRACRIMWSQRDPSLRKSGVGNIYVKNLDRNIDNKALYDTFSLFGNILSCKVACDANGKSRGYGFVHYETEGAAKQAIERVNGMQIGDKTVEVKKVVKRSERDTPKDLFTNLYIKNLPAEGFDEDKLKAMFLPYGPITSRCIMEDKQGRKFAFVNYETPEAAKKAIEAMNGTDIRTEEQKAADGEDAKEEDYQLYVGRAQTKAERARELTQRNNTGSPLARTQGVNLYVKNLDEDTDDEALKQLFTSFGTISSAVSMKDERGRCKGFGFVCFEDPNEATQAVTEMHLKVVKGKPLYVGLAEKREARQERLRQRYSPSAGMGGCKGDKGGKGKGKMGPMGPGMNMGGGQGGMYGPQGGAGAAQAMGAMSAATAMGGGMGAMGGMMGGAQMMGMMGKGGMMCGLPNAQMMGKAGPMMGAKGPMGMMGGPQMMGMMGKGSPGGMYPPQMMGVMGGKGGPMMGMPGVGPMGMMRPMMPQMQAGVPQPQQQVQQPQQPQAQPPVPGAQLTAAALASAPAGVQKQMLGEKLFPAVSRYQPELAGKITGMMLEMDNSELLMLLESESQLKSKVEEAMRVIEGGRTA